MHVTLHALRLIVKLSLVEWMKCSRQSCSHRRDWRAALLCQAAVLPRTRDSLERRRACSSGESHILTEERTLFACHAMLSYRGFCLCPLEAATVLH